MSKHVEELELSWIRLRTASLRASTQGHCVGIRDVYIHHSQMLHTADHTAFSVRVCICVPINSLPLLSRALAMDLVVQFGCEPSILPLRNSQTWHFSTFSVSLVSG